MAIKITKAVKPKSSKVVKGESPAAEYGDKPAPRKSQRVFATPKLKNYSTRSLEPKHKTYRGGSR